MPTLHWVGKDKVVNHHHEVPFRVLNKQATFSAPEGAPANTTANRIIHGDNLEALKSLLPELEGKVNCIYIDPPYNTGNEGWVYNDAVNDPKMKKWLGEVVGKEGEDLSRHDKWLCMMYPRLQLLKKLLASEGVMFISIDDDEGHSLRQILDEIFGRNCRLATFVWRTDGNFDNQAKIKNCHEYIFAYSKAPDLFDYPSVVDPNTPINSKLFKPVIRNTIVKNGDKNPKSSLLLPAGFPADFEDGVLLARSNSWPHYKSNCKVKNWKLSGSVEVFSGWSSLALLNEFIENNFSPILDKKGQQTIFKIIQSGAIEAIKVRSKPSHVITTLSGLGSTQSASTQLQELGVTFPFPKPIELVSYLISMIDPIEGQDFVVLDSFAGSGTTGHAVLGLNAKDNLNRKFILIEMLEYAKEKTQKRIQSAICGYQSEKGFTPGLGGGFDFYSIGETVFFDQETLNEAVGTEAIRAYVSHSEGIPDTERTTADNPHTPYLLGLNRETAWVFYYEPDRATALDIDFLASLRFAGTADAPKPGTAIIYADRCLLTPPFMAQHGIVFKKIPRDISRF